MILRKTFVAVLVIALALVPACGDSLSGKYEAEDSKGMFSVEFKSGKAYVTMAGMTTETDYEVKGDKVVFKKGDEKDGNMVMTIEKDGTISGGPLGIKLKKKS